MSQLKPKHWKALQLMEDGLLSTSEIAKACGMSPSYLSDCCEAGEKTGDIGLLFQAELRKMLNRKSSKIRRLQKTAEQSSLELIERELFKLKKQKNLTNEDRRRLIEINNSLAKSKPTVEIASVEFSRGLTKEDLVHEFKRLSSLAESTLKRGSVPGSRQGAAGILSLPVGSGDTLQEIEEASLLRAQSKTGSVPQGSDSD